MSVEKEDQRNAANIQAGIGSQILAATLVLIGFLLGYFDVKSIKASSIQGILLITALVFLFASFVIAGYGLKKLRNNGYFSGNWDYSKTNINFRSQTFLNYFAIILFIIVFSMHHEKSDQEKSLEEINMNLRLMVRTDSLNNIEYQKIISLLSTHHVSDSINRLREQQKLRRKKLH